MAKDTTPPTLTLMQGSARTCDSEPIHIPGSIQPHGMLLLFEAATGKLCHRAGDGARLLGLERTDNPRVDVLLGISIDDLIVSCTRNGNDEPVYVGIVRPQDREPLAMMAHRTECFVAVELMKAEIEGSVALALDMVETMANQINASQNVTEACNFAVEQVRAIVGFDSVMVYRFLEDDSGSVVAQSRTARATPYLGHRFPASDIPRQARDLYRRNIIRVIPDVDYQPAAIEPVRDGSPIDMSHCILRSVAPVHIDYLKNMGLGASMSVSLMIGGHLWGLIICHHHEPRLVPVESQLLCRHIGTALSGFVHKFERTQDALFDVQQNDALESVLKGISASSDLERQLKTACEDLKRLVNCGGFVLLEEGELIAGAGQFPDAEILRELSPLFESKLSERESFSTDRLGEFLDMPTIATLASGVLATRINGWRPLLALWLRPEQVEEIDWAGEPPAEEGSPGPQKSLTPRQSFATWREIVRGRSRPWFYREIQAVELFRTRVENAMQYHRVEKLNAELAEANTLLDGLATTDPLTGVPNRRLFDERLHSEWERARRHEGTLALVAIDIDHFKEFNDHFGHPAGDDCLKQIAASIKGTCRTVDLVARLGGEEFILLLPGIDASGAAAVAGRVRDIVQGLGIAHPCTKAGVVTISLGVAAASPSKMGGAMELLSAADRAMYRAKANGRNGIALCA